jgi:hypothetical protein
VTVTPTLYVSSGATVTLYGIAENNAQVDSAWIEVRPPSKVLNPSGGTGQLERGLTPDSMIWNGANSRYEKSYTVPAESGLFEVFYYTQRSSTLEVSTTRQSIFYVDPGAGSNPNAPTAPTLLMPADSATTKTELLLEWDPGCTLPAYTEETSCTANSGTWSTDWSICTLPAYTDRATCLANSGTWQLSWDADNQSVTYAAYIAEYGRCSTTTSTACSTEDDCPGSETCMALDCATVDDYAVYAAEELTYPALYVMPDAGLEDLTKYWWKVRAIDPYGRNTESACRTFNTDNTNSGVAVTQSGLITNGTNGPGITAPR